VVSKVVDEEEDTLDIAYVVVVGGMVIGACEGEGMEGIATECAGLTFPTEDWKVTRLINPTSLKESVISGPRA
jgi:hypothetical protein